MNKTLITVFCLILLHGATLAQTIAVTELGDTIYVYSNGTWTYEPQEEVPAVFNELSFWRTN